MKYGVGQLTLTFCLPGEPRESDRKDGAEETQDNGSSSSCPVPTVECKPARKRMWHSLIDKSTPQRTCSPLGRG